MAEVFGEVFSLHSLFTLLMLVFLQAVLGFDNLLYISIESKRVEEDKQSFVRRMGIAVAIVMRVVLLFVLYFAIQKLQFTLFVLPEGNGFFEGDFSLHSLIVLAGGAFIIYTAIKEIHHMLAVDKLDHGVEEQGSSSVGKAVTWIVIMNLVFSFDSILSAIALTGASHEEGRTVEPQVYETFAAPLIVMAVAIIASGLMMIFMADHVANFLKKNRMYEVLGLFILLIVGVMLVTDGGHLAHVKIWGNPVEKMSNTTFYFVIIVLVLTDIAQSRYQKKLAAKRQSQGQSV